MKIIKKHWIHKNKQQFSRKTKQWHKTNKKYSDKVFVSADKSRQVYKLGQSEYKKLLKENITKAYKKSDRLKENNVNSHAKRITKELPISDSIEKLQETEAYITIKDHKEDFPNISFNKYFPIFPFNKPFKIKYRKNKQSYSWRDQPINTTDHKSKSMKGHLKCNSLAQ